MANELNVSAAITGFKPAVMSTAISRALQGLQFTMNGNFYSQGAINCTTTPTAIPLAQVTQPNYAFFYSESLNPKLQAATTITGAANNGSGLIRITDVSHGYLSGDVVTIANVVGTAEANGTWPITVFSANAFDLVGSTFVNAYLSGGSAVLNNSIRIKNGNTGNDIGQWFPGWISLTPLPLACTPFVLANQTGQILEYLIFSW